MVKQKNHWSSLKDMAYFVHFIFIKNLLLTQHKAYCIYALTLYFIRIFDIIKTLNDALFAGGFFLFMWLQNIQSGNFHIYNKVVILFS